MRRPGEGSRRSSCGARLRYPITAILVGLASTAGALPDRSALVSDAGPKFLVRPYLQWPAPDAITVVWETDRPLPGSVEFGLGRDLPRTVSAGHPATLHGIRLTGLTPGIRYSYRVRSGPLRSEGHTFRTAPPAGTRKWRLAVYGDSRSNPTAHRRVVEQMLRAQPDLVVHTGDLVLDGHSRRGWRSEFFDPLAPLAASVPWISVLGNHEHDASAYFDYVALPGNKRNFALDYANLHLIGLDSNAWAWQASPQPLAWLTQDLGRSRDQAWTFVVFHHPLFSAHATRPINALRWTWAPVLLDPRHHVDAVLTGHDHFYSRNLRIGLTAEHPVPGVLFLTTAGGGATLYPTRLRDYVACAQSVYHFTLLDFDGDQVTISAIDDTGRLFDRHVLTKQPTQAGQYCAYEVETLREALRQALAVAPAVRIASDAEQRIDIRLAVPTAFRIPITGRLVWGDAPGWTLVTSEQPFSLRPGQPLDIAMQARVSGGPFSRSPRLRIAFAEGKFCNRSTDLFPFKLAGPEPVAVPRYKGIASSGFLTPTAWEHAPSEMLLAVRPAGGRADRVQFLADEKCLHVLARLSTQPATARVGPPAARSSGGRLVLLGEHVRLVLWDGTRARNFAVTPEQVRYASPGPGGLPDSEWQAAARPSLGGWEAEWAIPRRPSWGAPALHVNVIHHRTLGSEPADYALCPGYRLGSSPNVIPDWRFDERPDQFARLILPGP